MHIPTYQCADCLPGSLGHTQLIQNSWEHGAIFCSVNLQRTCAKDLHSALVQWHCQVIGNLPTYRNNATAASLLAERKEGSYVQVSLTLRAVIIRNPVFRLHHFSGCCEQRQIIIVLIQRHPGCKVWFRHVASLKQQYPHWCHSDNSNLRSNSPGNQRNLQQSRLLPWSQDFITSTKTTDCYLVFMSCLGASAFPAMASAELTRAPVLCRGRVLRYEKPHASQRNSKLHSVGSGLPPVLSYTCGHGHHHSCPPAATFGCGSMNKQDVRGPLSFSVQLFWENSLFHAQAETYWVVDIHANSFLLHICKAVTSSREAIGNNRIFFLSASAAIC